jgi:hypothetical protein
VLLFPSSREFSIATSASLSLAQEIVRVSPGAGMNGSTSVRRPLFIIVRVGYLPVRNGRRLKTTDSSKYRYQAGNLSRAYQVLYLYRSAVATLNLYVQEVRTTPCRHAIHESFFHFRVSSIPVERNDTNETNGNKRKRTEACDLRHTGTRRYTGLHFSKDKNLKSILLKIIE